MLLGPHFLVGAAIAANSPNPFVGFVLAFFSHFLLDRIPHSEYSIDALKQIKTTGIKYCMPIFRRVALDIASGLIVLVLAVTLNTHHVLLIQAAIGGFFGILPDGLSMLFFLKRDKGLFASLLKLFYVIHRRIHFSKEKGPPPFRIGLSTQTIAILLALYFLIF